MVDATAYGHRVIFVLLRPDFQHVCWPLGERLVALRWANHPGGQIGSLNLLIHQPGIIFEGLCTCSLRLIQQPDKPGKMPSFQHMYEGGFAMVSGKFHGPRKVDNSFLGRASAY